MTVKKYDFYIDTEKQEIFYEEATYAHYINPVDIKNNKLLSLVDGNDKFFRVLQEITVNSGHALVKELFTKNKIDISVFFYVYRNYKKVKLFRWQIVKEHNLPQNITILRENQNCFRSSLDTFTKAQDKNIFYIIEFSDSELLNYVVGVKTVPNKIKTYQDIIICQHVSNKEITNVESIKYRLYLNDRLLVERFFPEGLRLDKSLVESVYLELNTPSVLKIQSNNPLLFVKITADKKVFYPNSTEFILEP